MQQPVRIPVLGGAVDKITAEDVFTFAAERIAAGRKGIVANHNLHSLHLIRRSGEMKSFYARADLIECDGMPIIAWARLLGHPLARENRLTYLDWREQFWAHASANGWRFFYLGGAPGVAEAGAAAVRARWPGVTIDTADGYFEVSGAQNLRLLERINAFAPDILFVGMGMPRQEQWIARNYDRLKQGVVFPVGAAFDYEAGAQKTPPRWVGRLGVEWLYRFATDPVRLFTRYFLEPWTLVPAALWDVRQAIGSRRRGPPALAA